MATQCKWNPVRNTIIEARLVWTIENFSFQAARNEDLISPVFSAEADGVTKWKFRLSPPSPSGKNGPWFSLLLVLDSCRGSGIFIKCKLIALNANYDVLNRISMHDVMEIRPDSSIVWSNFLNRIPVVTKYAFPDDKLTFICEVSYEASTIPNRSPRIKPDRLTKPEQDLQKNLRDLYETQMLFDVVLVLRGKEYRAHKAILAARSSGFKTIFEKDCEELRTSRVELASIGQREFEECIRFIYTGKASGPVRKFKRLLSMMDMYAVRQITTNTRNPEETLPKPGAIDNKTPGVDPSSIGSLTDRSTASSIEFGSTQLSANEKQSSNNQPLLDMKKFTGNMRDSLFNLYGSSEVQEAETPGMSLKCSESPPSADSDQLVPELLITTPKRDLHTNSGSSTEQRAEARESDSKSSAVESRSRSSSFDFVSGAASDEDAVDGSLHGPLHSIRPQVPADTIDYESDSSQFSIC